VLYRVRVLWRNDPGFVYEWQMKNQQSILNSDTPAPVGALEPTWHVVGAGDFTGEGNADLLLRNISNTPDNGAFRLWEMNGANVVRQDDIQRAPIG